MRTERASYRQRQVENSINVELNRDDHPTKLLSTRNVPKQLFNAKPFLLTPAISNFTSEVEGLKPKRMSKQKQQGFVEKVLKNPFFAPYIMCISSNPNDLRAKQLAAFIMSKAIETQQAGTIKRLETKDLPLWHVVTAGFNNPLVQTTSKASMLILSNVPKDSTNFKLEQLRDILESYQNIPRIVITTGTDPISFFNSQIRMHLNMCVHLSNQIVKKVTEV